MSSKNADPEIRKWVSGLSLSFVADLTKSLASLSPASSCANEEESEQFRSPHGVILEIHSEQSIKCHASEFAMLAWPFLNIVAMGR